VRHVGLEGVASGIGRFVAPDLVDQDIGRDEIVSAQEKMLEDRSLPGFSDVERRQG